MEEKHEIEERQSSSTPPPVEEARIKNPGVAAVLSAVLPGLGQIYNGRFIWAIVWFICRRGSRQSGRRRRRDPSEPGAPLFSGTVRGSR